MAVQTPLVLKMLGGVAAFSSVGGCIFWVASSNYLGEYDWKLMNKLERDGLEFTVSPSELNFHQQNKGITISHRLSPDWNWECSVIFGGKLDKGKEELFRWFLSEVKKPGKENMKLKKRLIVRCAEEKNHYQEGKIFRIKKFDLVEDINKGEFERWFGV